TAPKITVTGTVADGVEAGSRLLRAGSVTYLLIGDAAARVPATGRVTVRGRVDLGRATTCMQGIPLEVIEVRPG
ncbi:MAG TPA: hypothetical protein VES42_17370, partial [Pilimelia sp.]|nr:hypothetical protein [Pilimelia sp.]